MNINAFGTDIFLRFTIRNRLARIKEDDKVSYIHPSCNREKFADHLLNHRLSILKDSIRSPPPNSLPPANLAVSVQSVYRRNISALNSLNGLTYTCTTNSAVLSSS